MIAVECPQCGAATPAFPLTPDRVACRACRYDGPPKPEVVAQLRSAAAQLGAADAHHARQIGATQAATLTALIANRSRLHRILIVLLLPLGTLASCTALASIVDDPNFTLALLCGLPMLVFGVAMAIGSRVLDRQVRELAEACGAVPPATPGAAAQCHLCGAGLPPTTSASPIVRCRHCGTDNVASPDILAEITKRRHLVVGQLERSIAHRGGLMVMKGASTVTWVFALGIASPFIGCAGAFGLQTALDDIELDTRPAEYVMTSLDGEVCMSLVGDKDASGTWTLYQPYGDKVIEAIPDAARYTRVNEGWIKGKRVKTRTGEGAVRGTATRVYIHVLRPERNQVWIRGDGTSPDVLKTIEGTCLLDAPKNLVAVEWPKHAEDAAASSADPASSGDGAPGVGSSTGGSPKGEDVPKKGAR